MCSTTSLCFEFSIILFFFPGMKNKIFISFSFSVEKEVTAIKEKIEREVGEGSCWICTTEIRAGDTLSKELTDAINGSDVMVCMINQKYIDSKICVEEVRCSYETFEDESRGICQMM